MKTKRIREVVFIAHRYIGLVVGILAAIIGLTGSLLIIHGSTSSLFEEKVTITPVGKLLAIATLVAKAQAEFPSLKLESLQIPKSLTEPITVWWLGESDQWTKAFLNPYTGTISIQPYSEDYTSFLYDIHINLVGGEWGVYVAGIVGLLIPISYDFELN